MHFEQDYIYHIYNRSNQTVFLDEDNYDYFRKKLHTHIAPVCNVLAWCIMPNHFHLLVQANEISVINIEEKHRPNTQQLSKNIGIALSSYTRGYNKRSGRRGSLWAHDTEAIPINGKGKDYGINCFNYIHHNPLNANLVYDLDDWKYSSYLEFKSHFDNTASINPLSNIELALSIFDLDKDKFFAISDLPTTII
jgi:REP element-mobilizing transposase RayT